MSMYAFLRGEVLDYARENICVNLEQLTIPSSGDRVWHLNDVGNFSCTVTNLGLMLLTNLKIHVYTNDLAQIRQSSNVYCSNWVNDLALEPLTIEPNEVSIVQALQFKIAGKTDESKDVIFAYIEDVTLSWSYYTKKRDQSYLSRREKLALQIR